MLTTLFSAMASLPELACRRLWRVPSRERVALVPSRKCSAPWYFRASVHCASHVDARKTPTLTPDLNQDVQPCALHRPRSQSLDHLVFFLPSLGVLGVVNRRPASSSVSRVLLIRAYLVGSNSPTVRDFHTPFSGVFQKIAHVPQGVLKPFFGIFS